MRDLVNSRGSAFCVNGDLPRVDLSATKRARNNAHLKVYNSVPRRSNLNHCQRILGAPRRDHFPPFDGTIASHRAEGRVASDRFARTPQGVPLEVCIWLKPSLASAN